MKYLYSFLLVFVFCSLSYTSAAQEVKKGNTKDKKSKKAEKVLSPEGEGEITTLTVDTSDQFPQIEEVPATLSITFDTSSIPNDELTAAIRVLLTEMKAIEIGLNAAHDQINSIRAQSSDEKMNEFYGRFIERLASEEIKTVFTNVFIRVYRKHFTVEEIRQILVFYKTPVGKKSLQLLPVITSESAKEGEKVGAYFAEKLFNEMQLEKKK